MGYYLKIYTVENLHFVSKNSTLISRENCRSFCVKNSWKLLTTMISQEKLSKNWVKNSSKYWGFVKIEFFGQKIDFSNIVI